MPVTAHPSFPPSALCATVSGTFRQAIDDVQSAVEALGDAGVLVLSPADPRIVDRFGDFVFVASDRVRHLRTVQARHLAAICASDFLWLVAPDGYVGNSASMEIGYASARNVPTYCLNAPSDLTLRQWVTVVPSLTSALARHGRGRGRLAPDHVLLDPEHALLATHDDLLVAQSGLLGTPTIAQTEQAEQALRRAARRLLLP